MMTIRTIDEYRAYISHSGGSRAAASKGPSKYFDAGFGSAAAVIRERRTRSKAPRKPVADHNDRGKGKS